MKKAASKNAPPRDEDDADKSPIQPPDSGKSPKPTKGNGSAPRKISAKSSEKSSPKPSPRSKSKKKAEKAGEEARGSTMSTVSVDEPRSGNEEGSPQTSPRRRSSKERRASKELRNSRADDDVDPATPEIKNGVDKMAKPSKLQDVANGSGSDDNRSDGQPSPGSKSWPGTQPTRERQTKLEWDTVVAVGALIVPTCKVHGIKDMEFRKGDGDGATAIDFTDLLDWVRESRAVGARASCGACGANLGSIMKKGDTGAPKYFGPDHPTGPRLKRTPSWLPQFCVGCDLAFMGDG